MQVAVVLDLDGTVYLGDEPLPGVRQTVNQLTRLGIRHSFMTNNSSRIPRYYEEKLRMMGIEVADGSVISSTDAAIAGLREAGIRRLYPVVTRDCECYLQAAGMEFVQNQESEAVLVGFDTEVNYGKLKNASLLISSGVPFLATHPDVVCPTERGFIPDCGAICQLLEASTGVAPRFFGKPERYLLDAAARLMNVSVSDLVVVGDRPYTDVRMGNASGAATILVRTGEGAKYDVGSLPRTDQPVLTLGSVADLTAEVLACAVAQGGAKRSQRALSVPGVQVL